MVLPPESNTSLNPGPSALFSPSMSPAPAAPSSTVAPPPQPTPLPSWAKHIPSHPKSEGEDKSKDGDREPGGVAPEQQPPCGSDPDSDFGSVADYDPDSDSDSNSDSSHDAGSNPSWSLPKIRLEIKDLSHPGAHAFLAAVNATHCLAASIRAVLLQLYLHPSTPDTHRPPTRSVTLILENMGGVANTSGLDLDPVHHKVIRFSLNYIAGIPPERRAAEITGVVVHELVHCYQWDGRHTCPGGLVEGIADWVRLRCRLGPPHWRRDADGRWDDGYARTAYFLDYLEGRFGEGTVRQLNEALRRKRYDVKTYWRAALGEDVDALWEAYGQMLKKEKADVDDRMVVVSKEDISDVDVREGR